MTNISKDKAVEVLTKLGIIGLNRAALTVEFNYCQYNNDEVTDKRLTESIALIESIVKNISIGNYLVELTDIRDPVI